MKFLLRLALPSLLLGCSGCARYGVVVDVVAADCGEVSNFEASFYADDGAGCDGQRFVAVPSLTLITRDPLPLTGVELPRVGAKIVIVEARRGDLVVGRGCAAVGTLDGLVHIEVPVTPTFQLTDASAESLVVGDPTVLDGDGESSAFANSVSAIVVTVADGEAVAGAAVRARLFAADGSSVIDEVITAGDDGRAVFAPTSAPAGPVQTRLTVENPATDGDTISPGFAVPVFELRSTAAFALRPFVFDGRPLFAGVPERQPQLLLFEGTDDGGAVAILATATTSMRLVGLATDVSDAGVGRDVFVVVADGSLAFVDGAGEVLPGPAIDVSAARFFSASSCDLPLGLPGVISDGAAQFFVDINDSGVAVAAPLDVDAGAVVGSFCVLDDDGTSHRVAVLGGDRPAVLDLGDGIDSAGAFSALPLEAGLENTIGLIARDDGLLVSIEADAGEVLVRLRRLSGNAFVDAGVPPSRLPSPPSFLAVGNFFGGNADLFALLSLGTAVRPDLAAVYGVGSTVAGGIAVPACTPAAACSDALAVDLDGDGFLEVLTSLENTAVVVRFR